MTVLVALGADLFVAVATSVATVITKSASLAAEAAHSWPTPAGCAIGTRGRRPRGLSA
jgi:hypothetical protein